MAKLTDLSIPIGLETLFLKLLGFSDPATQKYCRANSTAVPRARRSFLQANSYLLVFQPVYNAFTLLRKTSWQDYWTSLPFGGHHGANGYPGSGFSAFVYVNAPRYKAGLSLLLDPPVTDLVINGGFVGNGDHWEFGDSGAYSDNSAIIFDSGGGFGTLAFFQEIPAITDSLNYRIEYDVLSLGDPSDAFENLEIILGDNNSSFELCSVGHHVVDMQALLVDPTDTFLHFGWHGTSDFVEVSNISLVLLP